MGSAVIFKRILISILLGCCCCIAAQKDSSRERSAVVFNAEDSLMLREIDSMMMADTIDSVRRDTLVPQKFIGYDPLIYRNSKINLRKTLLASKNPPVRKNLDNWIILAWALLIALFIIFFKAHYALQYRLLNKAWISNIGFNEFFSTQTSVFKNSKLLTWLIISQVISMGVFIILKATNFWDSLALLIYKVFNLQISFNDFGRAGIISVGVVLLLMANQWLKTVFAFSFYQNSLSRDYAIIFRIQAYIAALFLAPLILFIYYNGTWDIKIAGIISLAAYIIVVYATSLVKFVFSGHFLQNESNFILILYLCAFEILPLLVLIKSINSLLVI